MRGNFRRRQPAELLPQIAYHAPAVGGGVNPREQQLGGMYVVVSGVFVSHILVHVLSLLLPLLRLLPPHVLQYKVLMYKELRVK